MIGFLLLPLALVALALTISNYAEDKLLDTYRNQSFAVATCYLKLHIGDPGEAGTANAAAETTRKAITWAAASGGSMAATGTPVASWTAVAATETYTHFSLWDASTAGNCLGSGALAAGVPVVAGQDYQQTALTFTLD